jgi:hypothetical protein
MCNLLEPVYFCNNKFMLPVSVYGIYFVLIQRNKSELFIDMYTSRLEFDTKRRIRKGDGITDRTLVSV